MKKKKKLLLIIGGAVLVIAVIILNLTLDTTKTTKVNAATVASRELIEIVTASGRIQPKTKVNITSEINGEIIDLKIREGDHVETGQLLVVLDTVQLRSDVDQARYAVSEIKARLDGASSTLEQRQEEYERQEQLYKGDLTSETAYTNAKYAYLTAKSTYEATDAQSHQFQARYEKQLDYLSKARIVAPMPGIITFLDCEEGEIAAAQTAFTQGKTLMTIANLDVFEVEVEVDETEIAKVALGQHAEIEVDALPDTTFDGEVVEIGNTALISGLGSQDQTTNFRVKVLFKDDEARIRPGMSATVDLTTDRRENVLGVPFASIVMRAFDLDSLERAREAEENDSNPVGVGQVHAAENGEAETNTAKGADEEKEKTELKGVFAIRDGKARFVQVKTGIADQKNIEVISGLSEGDSIISGPYRVLRTIKDGDKVKIDTENGKKKE